MADCCTLGAATEAAICNQGHLRVQTHAGNGGSWGQHLSHTRSTFGTFVANHHHISLTDLLAHNRIHRGFFGIKYPGGSFIYRHFRSHRRLLHHRPLWCQVAEQDSNASFIVVGIFQSTDYLGILYLRPLEIFAHCLAGNAQGATVNQIGLIQPGQHRLNPPSGIEIFQPMRTSRAQTAQVRDACAHLIEQIEIKIYLSLLGDGRNMQYRVGRAAQSHIYGDGVFKGFLGSNLARRYVASNQFHNLHTRLLSQSVTGCRHRRYGAIAREAEAQRLGETIHGIGSEHTGARTTSGASAIFNLSQLFLGHLL